MYAGLIAAIWPLSLNQTVRGHSGRWHWSQTPTRAMMDWSGRYVSGLGLASTTAQSRSCALLPQNKSLVERNDRTIYYSRTLNCWLIRYSSVKLCAYIDCCSIGALISALWPSVLHFIESFVNFIHHVRFLIDKTENVRFLSFLL